MERHTREPHIPIRDPGLRRDPSGLFHSMLFDEIQASWNQRTPTDSIFADGSPSRHWPPAQPWVSLLLSN